MRKHFVVFLLAIFLCIAAYPLSASADFIDIEASHPYSEAINALHMAGFVKGYGDGSFGINEKINRAEFIALAMKAKNISGGSRFCFKDVKKEWFAGPICEAKRRGFVKGYNDGFFRPQNEISFAEAAAIIANIFDLRPDIRSEKNWYRPYIKALEKKKAIPLSVISFQTKINRGQTAEILWRLLTETTNKQSMTYDALEKRNKLLLQEKMTMPIFFQMAARNSSLQDDRDFLGEMAAKAIIEMDDIHLNEYSINVDSHMRLLLEINGLIKAYRLDSTSFSSSDADLIIYKNTVVLSPHYSDKIFFLDMNPETATFSPLYNTARYNGEGSRDTFFPRGTVNNGLFYLKDKYAFYAYDLEKETLIRVPEVDSATVDSFPYSNDSDIPLIRDKKNVYVLDRTSGLKTLSKSPGSFTVRQFSCSARIEHDVMPIGDCAFAKDNLQAWIALDGDSFRAIDGIDAATATIADFDGISAFIYDKNGFYLLNDSSGALKKLTKADTSKLQHVYGTLYKDAQSVYFFDPLNLKLRAIEGVNADSFTITSYLPFEDKGGQLYIDSDGNTWALVSHSPFIEKTTKKDGWGYPFIIHYVKDPAAAEKEFQETEYDDSSYRMRSAEVWRDDQNIYLRKDARLVRADVDAGTFAFTGVYGENREAEEMERVFFFTDSQGLYAALEGKIDPIQDSSPSGFEAVLGTSNFYKDRFNVYYWSWKHRKLEVVTEADPATLKVDQRLTWDSETLKPKKSSLFAIDRKSIFFHDKKNDTFTQPTVRLDAYTKIGDYIFVKNGRVTFLDWENRTLRELPDADGFSFLPLKDTIKGTIQIYTDATGVFMHDVNSNMIQKIEGADPETFQRVGEYDSTLFKDINRVYFGLKKDNAETISILQGADPNSVANLNMSVAKDKHSVFIRDLSNGPFEKINGADATTFELLSITSFGKALAARDRFRVYYLHSFSPKLSRPVQVVQGADLKTFTKVKTAYSDNNYYFKDRNSVWVSNNKTGFLEKISGAKPATFDFETDIKRRAEEHRKDVLQQFHN